ncbi:MAG: recombinase family protein [Simkania sp.]|nr:recombinase family protein [Simkania sp.]MCB1075954.1 recombinase family protein [Simkania sp.]MCB1082907.1 recombinase family protein [Simkania sp.]
MKFGYARVSTHDQNLDLQIDALRKKGCEKIFHETVSGAKADRIELKKLLGEVRKGDVIMIWKLDRLARSLKDFLTITNELMEKGANLKSLNDPIDTTSSQGRLIFNIFASLAEFERDLIIERTQAGLSAARARGRLGGRKRGLSEEAKKKAVAAAALYKQGSLTVNEIVKNLDISRATLYKYLRHQKVKIGSVETKKETEPKVMPIEISIRVENNSKYVRGKKRSIEDIENYVLYDYDVKKLDDCEYELKIPYENEKDLEREIDEIVRGIDSQADLRNCFTEISVRALDGSDKYWY